MSDMSMSSRVRCPFCAFKSLVEREVNFLFHLEGICSGARIIVSLTNAMRSKSHSFTLATISQGLVDHGHHVTVLSGSNRGTDGFKETSFNDSLIYKIPYTQDETDDLQDKFTRVSFKKRSVVDYAELLPVAGEYFQVVSTSCKSLFDDPSHLQRLKDKSYDAIIGIPFCPCDGLLAEYLNISFIAFTASFRYETFNEFTVGIPAPSSYVPFPLIEALTDEMTFSERIYNAFYRFVFVKYLLHVWSKPFVAIQQKLHISPHLSIDDILGKAKLWLVNTNFALDFPRPTAPVWIPIGGILTEESKPLQQGFASTD
ncbi:UDP-glucuronosyltransferase 2A3-like [Lytechinus pictus]|uniref:UDP-glucuronosyltransferase 2A3-like n=1 Tax=Lytechinus pictus TaxID=7653 RepID=UPI0030B9C198